MEDKIELYDTTLRDGAQTKGVSFSVKDKLLITDMLDELGVDYIEGGWPGSNPKDTEFFNLMKKRKLSHARFVAFGSARRPHLKTEEDPNLRSLIEAGTSQITVFCKGWDIHITDVMNISLEHNLEIVYDTLTFLKRYVPDVVMGVEHFFDGYKNHPDYSMKIIETAKEAGAFWVGFADTNGGCLPNEIEKIIREVKSACNTRYSVHLHNDAGLAMINTMTAAQTGVNVLHATVNGLGERCGMPDLCVLIPNLKFKMGIDCIDEGKLVNLKKISSTVSKITNQPHAIFTPYVGERAFYHKAGLHLSAIAKNPMAYNHVDPARLGIENSTSVSDQSGRSTLLYMASKYGIKVNGDDGKFSKLLTHVKESAHLGIQYEEADISNFMLFKRFLEDFSYPVKIKEYRLNAKGKKENIGNGNGYSSETDVCLSLVTTLGPEVVSINGEKEITEGLKKAMETAFKKLYPEIEWNSRVVGLKTMVLDNTLGIYLDIYNAVKEKTVRTLGYSRDFQMAFLNALLDFYTFEIIT
ncbi:MAG: citramalate synthase [Spirochaetales bacterium]|nr:citramalate synthase [Spirochaetales bacterium]